MTLLTIFNRQLPLISVLSACLGLAWVFIHHLSADNATLKSGNRENKSDTVSTLAPITGGLALEPKTADLREISQWHLFGKFEPLKAPIVKPIEITKVEPDFSNLPETRIPLKLSGIAFSPDENRAFAMIITPDGRQADYQAGEAIGTEASVHLIEEKRVVIERDGKFEALSLPETSRDQRNANRTVRARPNRQPRRPLPNQQRLNKKNDQNRSNPEA